MSWKEVNQEMEKIEQIVSEMEGEGEDEVFDPPPPTLLPSPPEEGAANVGEDSNLPSPPPSDTEPSSDSNKSETKCPTPPSLSEEKKDSTETLPSPPPPSLSTAIEDTYAPQDSKASSSTAFTFSSAVDSLDMTTSPHQSRVEESTTTSSSLVSGHTTVVEVLSELAQDSGQASPSNYPSPRPPNLNLEGQHERKGSSGILRLDGSISGRRKSTAGSNAMGEPASPSPSADRLSVTFAMDDFEEVGEKDSDDKAIGKEVDADAKKKEMEEKDIGTQLTDELIKPLEENEVGTQDDQQQQTLEVEEEYNDSIMEITRGRNRTGHSVRRRSSIVDGSRRLSAGSVTNRHRRPSSAFTTSSADRESLLTKSSAHSKSAEAETLKLHKEVIEQAKYQLWPLDKKLRVITTAKEYVKRHESELQEKFAQSRTFSTIGQQVQLFFVRFFQLLWRFLRDFITELTPWQQRIKDIESHFGSVVSSYFIFLRWLFWMNLVITLVLSILIIVPEVLAANREGTGARKKMLPVEELTAYNLKVLWDFEGLFRYSPIFYGYFSEKPQTKAGYQIPLAYFCAGMSVYVFSFAIILKKMARNSKQSKLSEKGDECTFTWKVFASWDYGIANVETAHNKVASIVMGFREALVEEMEKEKLQERSWKLIGKRVFANFLVLLLLIGSAYAVILVVRRSTQSETETSWYRQNEITIVMSMISMIFPNFFELIGLLEQYHPRKAMRWMLARIMALNLLSLYTLIFALFGKTDVMIEDLRKMENMMKNQGVSFGLDSASTPAPIVKNCFKIPIPCNLIARNEENLPPVLSLYLDGDERPSFGLNETEMASNLTLAQNPDFQNFTTASNDSLFQVWLQDLGMRHPEDDCKSCISRCGHSCFDLCHIIRNCSADPESEYRSNSKLTTLVFLLRGMLNASDLIGEAFMDDFADCSKCVLNPGVDPNAPPNKAEDFTPKYPDPGIIGPSGGLIPLEDRHCTKQICRRRFFGQIRPIQMESPKETCATAKNRFMNDLKESIHLRQMCWETMFGQELVKLTIMDTVFTLGSIFVTDFLRSLYLRILNPYWFWDMEKKFPKYPDFKVAENILHLVNNQGMIWMGLFMAPGLPAINLVKLAIIMYARSWAVMTTNVPHETVFRASRSNNFYFILLLMMLFLCTLPVAYTIVWLKPSWHCGPFSPHERIFMVFTKKIFDFLPDYLHNVVEYFTSPGIVIPVFVLLVLIIYYLISLTGLLREANEDLKIQLHHERTEERRKLLQSKQGDKIGAMNASDRWKRLLGSALSSARQSHDFRRTSELQNAQPEGTGGDKTSLNFSERAIDVPGVSEQPKKTSGAKSGPTFASLIRKRILNLEKSNQSFTSMTEILHNDVEKTADDDKKDEKVTSKEDVQVKIETETPAQARGSLCNKFFMETESSSVSNGGQHADEENTDEKEEEIEESDEDDGNTMKPPKIWISKSASMEHDLD